MTDVAAPSRLPFAALGFAAAALLSSWNPLAAPFGLIVGVAAALLALRALEPGPRRGVTIVAMVLGLVAATASAYVLARTAGVGMRGDEQAIVETPGEAERRRELDEAAERTRAARDRARAELEALPPAERPAGRDELTGQRK